MHRRTLILFLLPLSVASSADLSTQAVAVVRQRCQQCHNAKVRMGNLEFSSGKHMLDAKPRVLSAIGYAGKIKMPPTGQLAAAEATLLKNWLDAGAVWPAELSTGAVAPNHWAFRMPVRPA